MPQELERGVIQIFRLDGKAVGTGFVVGDCLAVTCAHVAAAALGKVTAVEGGEVLIRFCQGDDAQICEVVKLDSGPDDVAFVRLQRMPEGVKALRLGRAGRSDGHAFSGLGYPMHAGPVSMRKPYDQINGVVPAALPGRRPLLEIKGDEIYYGMSGAPILDLVYDRVVGMVTESKGLEHRNLVYATTADTIQGYWPELVIDAVGKPGEMTPEQRRNVREHVKWGLLQTQKNLLDRFLDEYLGDGEAVPFGGRDAELAALDGWLADAEGKGYELLTAPAGRGKTHLVVQWAARRIGQADAGLRVVLVPVSIRFGTAAPEVHLQMLARALAQFYGDPIQETAGDTRAVWRNICADYLGRAHKAAGGRLVVIVDGLDESTDSDPDQWRALMGELPAGTKVLLSARWLGEEQDESGWRERLGLNARRAGHLDLPGLDVKGLGQVLESMGDPLKGYGQEGEIRKELLRLTQGDPLLVRLYVEDLHGKLKPGQGSGKVANAGEVLARLQGAAPDLKGYFEGWWQDQRKQWKAQGEDVYRIEDEVQMFLQTLAAAVAPLKGAEIEEVLGGEPGSRRRLERMVERAPRIVIGSGESGYALSHPRFGVYFYGEMDAKERAAVEGRFLAAGRRVLEGLKRGTIQPGESLAYFVLHSRDHLVRGLKEGWAKPQDVYDLLCEEWLRAHEVHSGTPASFLEDVEAAWEVAAKQPNGDPGVQVLAVLCFASVGTLSGKIPGELIAQAYRAGVLNQAQALAYIRQKSDLRERVEGLLCLVDMENNPGEPTDLLDEAQGTVRQIEDSAICAFMLSEIASRLSAEQQSAVLTEALAIGRQIEDADDRAKTLLSIATRLPVEQQAAVLSEALASAWQIEVVDYRAITLSAIVTHLPMDQGLAVARQIEVSYIRASTLTEIAARLPVEQGLAVARQVEVSRSRARALAEIAARLPVEAQGAVLTEALEAARQIEEADDRAGALVAVANRLPVEQQGAVLAGALEVAWQIENAEGRASAFAAIAVRLPAEQGLAVARQIEDARSRARALMGIVTRLPVEQGLAVAREIEDSRFRGRALSRIATRLPVEQGLAVARQIEDSAFCAFALAEIASLLPDEQQGMVLIEALAVARQIEDARPRASVLAEIAAQLSVERGLVVARRIEFSYFRAVVLSGIATQLPVEQQSVVLTEALTVARQIEYADDRASALAEISAWLPVEQQDTVLTEARAAAQQIEYAAVRASALAEIAARLPVEKQAAVLAEAILIARRIEDSHSRAIALVAIADRLPMEQQGTVLTEALAVAQQVEYADDNALAEIANRLPVEQGLLVARQIEYVAVRASALAAIAARLPAEQQGAVLTEALEVARQIEDAEDRSSTFAAIAARLPAEQGLAVARQIEYSLDQATALSAIAAGLPSSFLHGLLRVGLRSQSTELLKTLARRWEELCTASDHTPAAAFTRTLRAFQYSKREEVLDLVEALGPVIALLGGDDAMMETADAVLKVGKWWP